MAVFSVSLRKELASRTLKSIEAEIDLYIYVCTQQTKVRYDSGTVLSICYNESKSNSHE